MADLSRDRTCRVMWIRKLLLDMTLPDSSSRLLVQISGIEMRVWMLVTVWLSLKGLPSVCPPLIVWWWTLWHFVITTWHLGFTNPWTAIWLEIAFPQMLRCWWTKEYGTLTSQWIFPTPPQWHYVRGLGWWRSSRCRWTWDCNELLDTLTVSAQCGAEVSACAHDRNGRVQDEQQNSESLSWVLPSVLQQMIWQVHLMITSWHGLRRTPA